MKENVLNTPLNLATPFHPVSQLFPEMTADELAALAADIQAHGLHNPIWTWRGQIVDGRARHRACELAGVAPRYQEWAGGDTAALLRFVVGQNLQRRHLTASQRAVLALGLEAAFAVAAQERMEAGINQYSSPVEKIPQGEKGRARDQAAALVGVNAHYVNDAKTLQRAAPDLVARIAQGELSIPEAQRALVERQQAEARARVPAPVTTPVPLPSGRYRCIVLDPPWPVAKIERDVRPTQGVALDYPTLTLAEIAALPVPELAEPDGCHVYLWVTQKYLPVGLELFAAWGVAYQCTFTWNKNVGVTPYSWMYDTEHVLFGRIGHLPLLQLGLRLSFSAPVTRHSEKPDVFYTERVLPASPEPRLELFARQPRPGFTVWGAEVTLTNLSPAVALPEAGGPGLDMPVTRRE